MSAIIIPAARIGGGNFVYVTYANPTLINTANNADHRQYYQRL